MALIFCGLMPSVRPTRIWWHRPKSWPLTHCAVIVAILRSLTSGSGATPDTAPHHFVSDQRVIGGDLDHRARLGQMGVDDLSEIVRQLRELLCGFHDQPGAPPITASRRGGVAGRWWIRAPVASAMALMIAGATATVAHSAAPFAPRLAEGSTSSTISGTDFRAFPRGGDAVLLEARRLAGRNSSLRANPNPIDTAPSICPFRPCG